MANFLTSAQDIGKWVMRQGTADSAARKILAVVGENREQDIVETCRNIFKGDKNAENVLYNILGSFNITEPREANMSDKISSSENGLKKEAQAVMRTDSLYGNLPMKICPKLPKQSAGQQLISSYNCRTYCLDSMVLDENPDKVYCLEAIWRRHIMDKFAREFKDKNGKWVGGYINERFQVYHDDGGNQMQLANGERARQPRPHEWSVERRMDEQRGAKTQSIVLNASACEKMMKTASTDDVVIKMFSDAVDMHSDGLTDEEAISQLAEHYKQPIDKTASVFYASLKRVKAESQNKISYSFNKGLGVNKTAAQNVQNNQFAEGSQWQARGGKAVVNGKETELPLGTTVVVEGKDNAGNPVFSIGGDLSKSVIQNPAQVLTPSDDRAAQEVGLEEPIIPQAQQTEANVASPNTQPIQQPEQPMDNEYPIEGKSP